MDGTEVDGDGRGAVEGVVAVVGVVERTDVTVIDDEEVGATLPAVGAGAEVVDVELVTVVGAG